MAKKKDNSSKQTKKETTIEDFYDLKTKEMDELVAALNGEIDENTPVPTMNIAEITGEVDDVDEEGKHRKRSKRNKEFDPYKRDVLSRIPTWLKAFFIKFWFFGCVCYFVIMGLGVYLIDDTTLSASNSQYLDLLVLCGIVMGIIVDILVGPIFRMMESDRKEYNNFLMFPFPVKRFWTFFTNIIYYIIVVYCVGLLYSLLDLIGIYS
ncbi:MAG: hypothetical protein LUI60_06555, partial [Clostridia bacterium]|nr:hypothetical protein [Clostridia bacterium]